VFDELDWLREDSELRRLLAYYAEAGAPDREASEDGLMALDGVEARELVRLHGLLIAFGWAEQNTGHTPACQPWAVPACYRATAAGIRGLKLSLSSPAGSDLDAFPPVGGAAGAARGNAGEPPTLRPRERRTPQAAGPVAADAGDAAVSAEAPAGPIAALAD
jgi:hypothetical protein